MGIFLANRDAPSRCTATDCLVSYYGVVNCIQSCFLATSDNLEAVSEAASSHSVGSDLDNENDNLSDMVSANVSGRGTPNISGRDTPISQAEEGPPDPGEDQAGPPNLPVIVPKTNREDVTDRFGKFEIKQELERKL